MAPLRRPLVAVLLACPACFNPGGGGSSGSSSDAATDPSGTSTAGPAGSTGDPAPTTGLTDTAAAATSDTPVTDTTTTTDETTSVDTTDTTATTTPITCGDGVVDDGEDCDPGAIMLVPGCSDTCKRTGRFVFVTNEMYMGGELVDLETIATNCDNVAPTLPGFPDLTFTVWLSGTDDPASGRVDESDLPFIRLDGTLVAADRTTFVGGMHQAPINITQTGFEVVTAMPPCADNLAVAWTGTAPDGQPAAATCNDWLAVDATPGVAGIVTQTDDGWTSACPTLPCSTYARFYCVENP